jgi:hypothetical protein
MTFTSEATTMALVGSYSIKLVLEDIYGAKTSYSLSLKIVSPEDTVIQVNE